MDDIGLCGGGATNADDSLRLHREAQRLRDHVEQVGRAIPREAVPLHLADRQEWQRMRGEEIMKCLCKLEIVVVERHPECPIHANSAELEKSGKALQGTVQTEGTSGASSPGAVSLSDRRDVVAVEAHQEHAETGEKE